MGFPCGSAGKESTCNAGNLGSIPGLGIPGEVKGYLFRYSGLENSMDCIDNVVAKSRTRLNNFRFHFSISRYTQIHLRKGVIVSFPSDSVVKHLTVNARAGRYRFNPWAGKIPWSRKCQPAPVFLPRKSHGQWSLMGYNS